MIVVLYQEHLTDINSLHFNNLVRYYDNLTQQTKEWRPRKINTFLNTTMGKQLKQNQKLGFKTI